MCYISETGLPWGGQDTIEQMGEMKHKYPLDILLIPLGEAFVEIGKHVESLQYSDTPNYALMHQILRKSITTEKPFQWMALNPTLSPKKSKEIPLENDPTGFLVERSARSSERILKTGIWAMLSFACATLYSSIVIIS